MQLTSATPVRQLTAYELWQLEKYNDFLADSEQQEFETGQIAAMEFSDWNNQQAAQQLTTHF